MSLATSFPHTSQPGVACRANSSIRGTSPIACWLDVDAITRVLLISSVMLVMIVEILNSAIEAVVDRIGSEYHELSGRAKDMGSAAVLIAIIVAVATWVILLWSHFG